MVMNGVGAALLWGAVLALYISNMLAARSIEDPAKGRRAKLIAGTILAIFFACKIAIALFSS